MSQFTDALKQTQDPEFHSAYADAVEREQFLKMLVQMRVDARIPQMSVAEAMGVGQSTISQFENATDPRLSTVQRYARAIGAQVHFVATTRALQPSDWAVSANVQQARTSVWSGESHSATTMMRTRSAYAKAA